MKRERVPSIQIDLAQALGHSDGQPASRVHQWRGQWYAMDDVERLRPCATKAEAEKLARGLLTEGVSALWAS